MKVGAHVSTAGGLDKAVERAVAIEAEAIQIFGSPPQGWALKPHAPEVILRFREKAQEAGLGDDVFLHGVYLVNLATENQENLKKGIDSLSFYVTLAHHIDAKGVVFHVGSHKGSGFAAVLPQIARSMTQVLERSEGDAWLIIENNAGQGQQVGGNFGEIRQILDAVGSSRVKVCLDTAHCLASGYEITTAEGVAATMGEFAEVIGLANLVAVHANDSKVPLGSGVDRHENIGDGHIGKEGFRHILAAPAFAGVPFLLEVPGIENKGPDLENIRRLKRLREEALG